MGSQGNREDWTSRIVRDPAQRDRELRWASLTEAVFSLISAALAVLAIWALLADPAWSVGGLAPVQLGGLAVLCFAACMAVAAGGGIRKRLIGLVRELESRQR